jgi:CAAX prenyl protease-like protein
MERPNQSKSIAYIAPFAAYVGLMALEKQLPLSPLIAYTLRIVIVLGVLFVFSRRVASFRLVSPLLSIVVGAFVFVLWVGPDFLIANYRQHWLFTNPVTGAPVSTLPGDLKENLLFLTVRAFGSFAVVPIIEELFWRAWLMRWLIDKDFEKVPLGTYQRFAFWATAVLFAVEHGPYWEVGLLAGIIYNWWMVKTGSVGDCILAHAITNGVLAAYVVASGQWQYWL